MKLVQANAKWLTALACGVMIAGAAVVVGEVGHSKEHAEARDVRELSKVFREVAKKARPSIVTILTTGKAQSARMPQFDGEDSPFGGNGPFGDLFKNQPEFRQFRQRQMQPVVPHGMGSGFVIDPRGIIMTNTHVVNGAAEVKVRFADGRELTATGIKTDPRTDIAILRVTPKPGEHFEALPLGNSDLAEVGDWVLAVGSPFSLDMTVTAGIISAKGRRLDKSEREDFIQTDAAINPGNSGGPLLNLDGEVIGINTAISTRSGGYEGIGFAVPINMAHWVSDQLIANGSVHRAYLGVGIQPVKDTVAAVLHVSPGEGAVVGEIKPNSPAEKAGLKTYDVILDLNGQKVSGPTDLASVVERLDVGKTYPITIVRDGKRMTLSVTMKEMPAHYSSFEPEDAEQGNAEKNGNSNEPQSFEELGIEVRELTPELTKQLGLKNAKGVVVGTVKPGSPAAEAGLGEGMVIEAVNKQPVATAEQFKEAMKHASLKTGLLFQVRTDRGTTLLGISKN
ncbi:MAG TPA: Do family serine endopeptidase [Planctomycetaceae bacterium]|nr:Do family serine endopeptidase [Planctomycetaceae bacterium]